MSRLGSSRIIVSTRDHWSENAEKSLKNQQILVIRLILRDLANSSLDWSSFNLKRSQVLPLKPKKTLLPHQSIAREKAIAHFTGADHGFSGNTNSLNNYHRCFSRNPC